MLVTILDGAKMLPADEQTKNSLNGRKDGAWPFEEIFFGSFFPKLNFPTQRRNDITGPFFPPRSFVPAGDLKATVPLP